MIEKVTAILMHYVFSRDGVVTHFMHSYDDFDTLYFKFPHLYCISILEDVPGGRQVMGGLFVKTDHSHKDADFVGVMCDAALSCVALRPLMESAVSIAPSLLGSQERIVPDERELLRVAMEQFTLRSRSGSA